MDAASAECHLALLESHFRQLCQVQQQIEEIDLEEDSRDQFEAAFIATKSKLLKRARVSKRNGPEDSVLISSTCLGASSHNRLPSLKLPKFDGKYGEYNRFIAAFNHMVHDDVLLSDIDKFTYLIGCLSGPALSVVAAFQVSEENYKKALERLKERYDKKVLILLEHVSSLFSI